MNDPLAAALVALLGYVLGSVPIGLLVGRIARGIDVREYGSGKTGFTNILRSVGLGPALLVVFADVSKGALPVLVGRFVFDEPWAAAAGGAAAVIGHTWPLFAGFRGGRGVATAFGAFLAVSPLVAVAVFAGAALVLAITRYVSLMSMLGTAVGFLALLALVLLDGVAAEYLLFGTVAAGIIEVNHIGNLRRLLRGTEPKLGQGGTPRRPAGA